LARGGAGSVGVVHGAAWQRVDLEPRQAPWSYWRPKRGTQSASFRAGLARPNLIDPLGPKSSCSAPAIHEKPIRAERRLSFNQGIDPMAEVNSTVDEIEVSRERLADLLNEDLAREYQAIIAYVVYSQVLTGAQYMDIAAQLEIHARQELDHALILSRQIDYLGKMPVVTPKPVRTSKDAKEMLRFDLDNENETIRNYRDRVRQCEALGEYALAEQIRQILTQEQDHQIDLATALGIEVPNVNSGPRKRSLPKRR
jgi:bacterioferritin